MNAHTGVGRVAIAILVLGSAVVGALFLHEHRVMHHFALCTTGLGPVSCTRSLRPGWVDPTALGIVFVGLAAAISLVRLKVGRSLATAVLVVGVALVGAFILYGHRAYRSTSCVSGGNFPEFVPCVRERGWADPTAVGICFVGLAGATASLLTARRSRRSK